MEKVSFFSDWHSVLFSGRNELVFENKNKDYGAYVIRRDYSRSVIVSTGIVLSILAGFIISALVIKTSPLITEAPLPADNDPFTLIELPIEPPLPQVTPTKPPPTAKPAVQTLQYTVVKPTDAAVQDVPPTQDQLAGQTVASVTHTSTNTDIDYPPVIETPAGTDEVYSTIAIEEQPLFPGGYAALQAFLANHIKYPEAELEEHIQGKTFLSFIIDKDGSVTHVELLKGIPGGANLDKEAMRVVKLMPQWSPGKQNGKAVRVKYVLPVQFRSLN